MTEGLGSTLSGVASLYSALTASSQAGHASARQYMYNLALQKQAQKWNEKVYKNRYQWQRADLEAAGINPLYGLGSAPMATSGQGSVGLEDDQGAKNGRMQSAIQLIGMAQDWSAKKAQIENIKQQTLTEQKNTLLKEYEINGKELENILKKKDIDAYDKRLKLEIEERQAGIKAKLAEIDEKSSAATLNRANTALVNANTENAKQENIKNRPGVTKSQELNKWLEKNPKWAGALKAAEDAVGVLGVLGGTIVGTASQVGKVKSAKYAAEKAKYKYGN